MKLRRTLDPGFSMLLFVPVAGVLALGLIFLLLSNGFLLQPGIAVKAPESPFLLAPQHDPKVVSITGDPLPAIYFDSRRVDGHQLETALAALKGNPRTIIIKADRRAPVEMLVQVTNVAISRGFAVVLATSEP